MKSKLVNGERLYYLANGSLVKRSQTPHYKDIRKKRYAETKEESCARARAWYRIPANRERARLRHKLWREENIERRNKIDLAYVNSERGYIMGLWQKIKPKSNMTREIFFKFCYDHRDKMNGWLSKYSGQQMTMQRSIGLQGAKRRIRPTNMSVDRVDNKRLYMLGNMVLCTWEENNQKGAMSIKLMRRVLEIVDSQ